VTNPYYWSPHWRELRAAALERDSGRCTAPGCCAAAVIVDHIQTRPRVPYPTSADRLGNLRSLCRMHDNQIKEQNGARRRGGRLAACVGADGWPIISKPE
jgi:hypothetical protein